MATINELLSKNLDRKYGPIEAHEVIERWIRKFEQHL